MCFLHFRREFFKTGLKQNPHWNHRLLKSLRIRKLAQKEAREVGEFRIRDNGVCHSFTRIITDINN
jgi:hypothetical protein